ncbi:MAG: ABC transporter permease subunit [Litorilinea sp.]
MSQQTTVLEQRTSFTPDRTFGKRLKTWLGADYQTAYLFVLPMVVLLGGLIAYPFARAVIMSFTNTVTLDLGPFVGLRNFENLWRDSAFRNAVGNTVEYTVYSVIIKFALGLLAAVLLSRIKRFRNVLTGLVLLPWIVPHVVIAITWRNLLDPTFGGINRFLIQTGLVERGYPWLGAYETAMPSIIMVNIWQGIPFFAVMMLAGLSAIDSELYEAARIDGATAWRLFLHVTLPGLRYVIIVAVLLSTIWTFNDFTVVFLLTGGGPAGATRLYSILAFEYAIASLRYSTGVAVAITMAPVLAVAILILGRYMTAGGGTREDTSSEKPSRLGQLGSTITWPFRMLLRAVLGVFWVLNNALENVFAAIGDAFSRRFIGENETRKNNAASVGRRLTGLVAGILLTLLLLFELTPFYWVIITAFKTTRQWTSLESVFWPAPWTLTQLETLLGPTRNFLVWYRNTVVVALVTTVVAVGVASLGAYALTRLRWRGSSLFGSVVLIAYLMPPILMFIPMYQILAALRLTNKLEGLMVTYPALILPFATWLLMGYYASIPEELENAALIDGCNRFQAWYKIVLPLAAPAMMAAGLFAITLAWKEFIFAYVFLAKESLFTLSVGLAGMIIGDVLPWGELMAAALLMAIPVVIIYMIGQKFMVAGLTAGAVKG